MFESLDVQNSSVWSGVLVILTFYIAKRIVDKVVSLRQALSSISGCPGGEILWIHPFRALAFFLSSWYPAEGQIGSLRNKFSVYKKYGSTCLSTIVFGNLKPVFWIADADAIKIVTADRHNFPKDMEAYEGLDIYGESLLVSEGSDWKRHRTIARSAFNEANNGLVWAESIRITNEWFNQLDLMGSSSGSSDITFDTVPAMTQFTLLVISAAGFGRRWSWAADVKDGSPGHQYSFPSALNIALYGLLSLSLTPEWCVKMSQKIHIPFLSRHLKKVHEGIHELRIYILEVISTARAWVAGGRSSQVDAALLINLAEANMMQEGDTKNLTDDELISNIFTFLVAGQETSAHTLSFAITLLALYPDVQRKVLEEVVQVWPEGMPTSGAVSNYKDDFPKLQYTLATFHETLRCFPAVPQLAKLVKVDAVLPARRFTQCSDGPNKLEISEEFNVNVPAGSLAMLDFHGVHMNPLNWGEDAEEFKPERFMDTDAYRWPRNSFFAFAAGPRNCIGQRFALTEGVCLLASIVRTYEILIPQKWQSLPFEEQKRIMTSWFLRISPTPSNAHVRLRRRS